MRAQRRTLADGRRPPASSRPGQGARTLSRVRPGRPDPSQRRRREADIGLDINHEFPKPLTDEVIHGADVVITMGCGDACSVYPGKRYLDWDVPDPAGKPSHEVAAIRNDIDRRVRALLGELT
jgi:protein-tyrosine-phosphatase